MEKALPVAVEAERLLCAQRLPRRQDGGREALHPRLVADYRPFLDARADLGDWIDQASVGLDERELALIEAREGKSPAWHRLHILSLARAAGASAPEKTDPSKDELKRFDAAVAAFADAVTRFDTAGTGLDRFIERANSFVGTLRTLRSEYGDEMLARMGELPPEFAILGMELDGMQSVGDNPH